MAENKIEGKETVEIFKELDKNVVQSERFIERNAKKIGGALGVVVLGVLAYFGYQHFIVFPQNEEATMTYLTAQKNLGEGKNDLALGGKSTNPGFKGVADNFSGTNVGKLSAYNAGIIEFNKGNYQKAYDLLNEFSSENKVLMALKFGAMADCMVNLNKNEEALSLFDKAISASNDEFTSFYFTRKAGVLALGIKKQDMAKRYFLDIEEKYQDYDAGVSDAYIEMVKQY